MFDATTAHRLKAARFFDRAVPIWGVTISILAALGGEVALTICCIALPLVPKHCHTLVRIILILIAAASYILGPSALMLATPAALALSGYRMTAGRALIVLVAVANLSHHFESLGQVDWLSIHPGSTAWVIGPVAATAIIFGPTIGWRSFFMLIIGAIATLILVDAGAARWINYVTFTNPFFHLGTALIPVIFAGFFISANLDDPVNLRSLTTTIIIGATIALFPPSKPVSSIMFDEAHGSWETVQAPFGPDDFGRAVNYTYSVIFKYAARVVGGSTILKSEDDKLPEHGVFVLKMPTRSLSENFANRLEKWVRAGGRLLIVADHTDLYDTTQNLNAFLTPRFGLRINSDAVYDKIGMPAEPVTRRFAALFGQIDANNYVMPWQTGASLKSMPLNMVRLSTYGRSFSEPGDYSRQNRFGPFIPRTSLRYSDHLATGAFGVGDGAVAIILDSTPWSNFSQFKEQYRHLFSALIYSLERPAALNIWGWGSILLFGIGVLSSFWRNPVVIMAGGILLGMTISSSAQIGAAAFWEPLDGRDFGLRVVSGDAARFEFLKQLVGPGERNYSRIISAMAKYDLDPMLSASENVPLNLERAKRWLLIEPNAPQLPTFEALIEHLQRGSDFSILFSPEQAAEPYVRQWLTSLGIYLRTTLALAVAEDAKQGLLNREGAALLRDIRVATSVQASSRLKSHETDVLLQSYTVRPTTLPRTSGLLILSFSADQFSDGAVGEVWDGIQVGSLGRHRERQIAFALKNQGFIPPFPDNLLRSNVRLKQEKTLSSYALFSDGKILLNGRFSEPIRDPFSPSDNSIGYLADLRDRVVSFVIDACPKKERVTKCEKHLLGPDSVEWMVTWIADAAGQIDNVELLHERRFSGMGSTVNVIFGE